MFRFLFSRNEKMERRIGFVVLAVVFAITGCNKVHKVDGHNMTPQPVKVVEAADLPPRLPPGFMPPNLSASELPSPEATIGDVGYYERSAFEAKFARMEEEIARLKQELEAAKANASTETK
jgi:hypothetical protein